MQPSAIEFASKKESARLNHAGHVAGHIAGNVAMDLVSLYSLAPLGMELTTPGKVDDQYVWCKYADP